MAVDPRLLHAAVAALQFLQTKCLFFEPALGHPVDRSCCHVFPFSLLVRLRNALPIRYSSAVPPASSNELLRVCLKSSVHARGSTVPGKNGAGGPGPAVNGGRGRWLSPAVAAEGRGG